MFRLALLVGCICSVQCTFPDVNTKYGPIRGMTVNDKWGNTHSWAWKGIPYASPPSGTMRFKEAVPHSPWTTLKNTVYWGHACPQHCTLPNITCPNLGPTPTTYSEDCLFLNVFTPFKATPASKLPVLFFIHGGDFKQGAGGEALYDSNFFSHFTSHVIVTINYRLGALGWLTQQEAAVPTNLGFKDQRLALQWVQDNIAGFGGDPSHVTVWGQSAGSISVACHMTSSLSKGLFHAAIGESNPFAIGLKSLPKAIDIGKHFTGLLGLNCKKGEVLKCMQSASLEEIVRATDAVEAEFFPLKSHKLWEWIVFWAPTIDINDIPDNPLSSFQAGHFDTKVPYIMGFNKDDARPYVYQVLTFPIQKWDFDLLIPILFGKNNTKAIEDMYPIPSNETKDARDEITVLTTDYTFACATWEVARSISSHGGMAYLYNYSHALSMKGVWGPKFKYCEGYVCHAAELPVLFNSVNISKFRFQPDEIVLAKRMESLWSQLEKVGSMGGSLKPFDSTIVWPPVDAKAAKTSTMILRTGNLELWSDHLEAVCPTWKKIGWYH